MVEQEELILRTLDELKIEYKRYTHPPVMTVSEAMALGNFDADGCKNLFFYDKKAARHYLVVMLEHKRAHSNTIRKQVKASRLEFGSEEDLARYLGVKSGAVSPLGVIYDEKNEVTVLLDRDLKNCERVCFHPNVNTATIVLPYGDLERYLIHAGNPFHHINVSEPEL